MIAWAGRTLRALALGAAIALPAGVSANGLAGDYLAARAASIAGDYQAAADYYGRAIVYDPANPQLLERAILATVSLGEIDRASALAEQLTGAGHTSQIAHMAMLADALGDEDFAKAQQLITDGRGAGPLVDGLVSAWSYLGAGDLDAMLSGFDAVAGEPGLGSFAAYHKALALASVGDFEGAEAILGGNTVGGMQMTRRAVMARAEILSQLGRFDDALALIDTSFGTNLDPGLSTLRETLASETPVSFSHVRSARDGAAEVFYTVAGALSNEANDDFTLLYTRVAEHLRPGHVDAILLSAEMLENMRQFDLAVATYKRVPRDDPSYHAAELGRAGALRRDDRVDAAVEVLEQLTETHGDLPVVQSTLGDLMRQLENYEPAIDAYSKALATFDTPDRAQWFLYYARAISYERLGEWDNAEADFRAALDLNPDQPQVLNYLGYSLVEQQSKLDEALEMIQRAVAAEPKSGYILDSLGWVYYRLGRYEDAVEWMEQAAELMPIDPVVNDHLGDVYWAVGRTREAEFMWKRALSFVDWENASEEVEPDRIRRKIEIGLDAVLAEEGAPPLQVANDNN